jgi:ABC-type bacteriocin/lantibiotic exporter with double-glycine peptidase domain
MSGEPSGWRKADSVGLKIVCLKSELAGPFDLHVPRGGAVTSSGASGSGKSLFLRVIADLDRNEGQIELDVETRAAMPAYDWRRKVPYVAAESGWWRDDVMEHF